MALASNVKTICLMVWNSKLIIIEGGKMKLNFIIQVMLKYVFDDFVQMVGINQLSQFDNCAICILQIFEAS